MTENDFNIFKLLYMYCPTYSTQAHAQSPPSLYTQHGQFSHQGVACTTITPVSQHRKTGRMALYSNVDEWDNV